jgi:predicted glycosyltransferase involved in capsule biosynthesis
MYKLNIPGRGESDNQKINLTGGIVIFTRSGFEKVGKWDEGFIGWGGEDMGYYKRTPIW